ncbi:MAG: hypothetical protein HYZ48_00730, partial [Chlamydiales bacterium]|nr:hypothetical protein [Chlamydiales bacterium]
MSQQMEIQNLIHIAPPEIALITKISLAHAAFFPDGLDGIARAKGEIFSHPKTRVKIAHAQANRYDSIGKENPITYSWKEEYPDAGYLLEKVDGRYQIREEGKESPFFSLPFEATHLCENFLGAAIVARQMGLSWEEIFERAQHLKTYKNRFELIDRDGILFVNDSYNASETSMLAALKNLPKPSSGGKRIAVLGSMRELGSFSDASHLRVAQAALYAIDHLICIGIECQPMIDHFHRNQKEVCSFDTLSEI